MHFVTFIDLSFNYSAFLFFLPFVLHRFLRDRVSPLVTNEAQFLYVCHLVGPFLQRFSQERLRCLQEVSRAEHSERRVTAFASLDIKNLVKTFVSAAELSRLDFDP